MQSQRFINEDDFFPTDDDQLSVAQNVSNHYFGDERTMTFMASIPGFSKQLETAVVLPISPLQLNQRLSVLDEGAEFVRDFEKSLFGFSSAPDEVFLKNAKQALDAAALVSEQTVAATRFLIEQRLLIGLIRRSLLDKGLPDNFTSWIDFLPDGAYGIAKSNSKSKDFGLSVFGSHLAKLIDHLETDEAILAEELILRHEWQTISQMAFSTTFNMEAVLLYVMKWHILRQWLARRPEESVAMINAEIDKIFEKTEIKL